jgi:hypothetical protein
LSTGFCQTQAIAEFYIADGKKCPFPRDLQFITIIISYSFTDNKKNTMNKRINFEDTLFILNVRIRMIRDLLRLDIDADLFFRKTMEDLEFINGALVTLMEKFLANLKFLDRETEADNLLDAEWQFSQILNEIFSNSSPFSPAHFPDAQTVISKLRKDSAGRQKQIEESYVPTENSTAEPVVSHAELNGLLGSA